MKSFCSHSSSSVSVWNCFLCFWIFLCFSCVSFISFSKESILSFCSVVFMRRVFSFWECVCSSCFVCCIVVIRVSD